MDIKRSLFAAIRQTTGRQYPDLERELSQLSEEGQRDLLRLVRDLEGQVMMASSRAKYGSFFR